MTGAVMAIFTPAANSTTPGAVSVAANLFTDAFGSVWHQEHDGLLGQIDHQATGHGVIVCRDGFKATTVSPDEFAALTAELEADVQIYEVDASSVFCEITI